MTTTAIPVSEAIDEGLDFVRDSWREAWALMAFTGVGWMLLVVGGCAQISPQASALTQRIGWALQLFNLPLLGALYRLGLGGQAYRSLGPGGLQLGGVEWRVLAVNVVLGVFCLLVCLPMAFLSGVFFLVLHRLGGVTLGPFGHWAWWFLVSAAFLAALMVWLAHALARLSMATPLSVEHQRVLPFTGWPLTAGHGRTVAASFILTKAPTLAILLALAAFGWIEASVGAVAGHGSWPLPDAVLAGAVVGLALSVFQAPLSVGVLIFFYDALAPAETTSVSDHGPAAEALSPMDAAAPEQVLTTPPPPDPPFSEVDSAHTERFSRIDAPELAADAVQNAHADLAAAPETPANEPAIDADAPEVFPHSIVEYSPHTGRFSRLFAPWLADDSVTSEGAVAGPVVEAPPTERPEAKSSQPTALDGAGEAEHAEP